MRVTVNAMPCDLASPTTVLDLVRERTGRDLDEAGRPRDGRALAVAVAVGGAVLPRAQWSSHELREGDDVDVVTAVQGG